MNNGYDHSAQEFVDALNAKTMQQLGYVFRNGRWEWPNRMTKLWEFREVWNGPLISTGERIPE